MGMATLQFYKNKYHYPDYSNNITPYGAYINATPIGINLKSGKLRVKGNMQDFMNCNYLKITRDNEILFAWIDNVEYHTENSFVVSYTVDAWRTYKNKINLGTQFIERSPTETYLKDNMLSSTQAYPRISSKMYTIGKVDLTGSTKRYFIVQVRGKPSLFGTTNTPVNPSPYEFFVAEYNSYSWRGSSLPIVKLMDELASEGKPNNIVTMYSVPYINLDETVEKDLPITRGEETEYIKGFRAFSGDSYNYNWIETPITFDYDINDIINVPHSIQIVIPEAGIMTIPDELAVKDNLVLRQDVDIFSGASNYMLKAGSFPYQYSVRGSSISSVPIVSDPLDTYLSQNQNALATSLIGDVASITGGLATGLATGGVGAVLGAGGVAGGISSITSKIANMRDISNRYSNPPAFLGTALGSNYNQRFWIVTTWQDVKNKDLVHSKYGYPYNMVDDLYIPSKGFIKTEGCNVSSTDGSVPRWVLEEVNTIFDSGINIR